MKKKIIIISIITITIMLLELQHALFLLLLGLLVFLYHHRHHLRSPAPTFLLDFACYSPPPHLAISNHDFIHSARTSGYFTPAALHFQQRILLTSGIGDHTYMPSLVFKPHQDITLAHARDEAAMVMFGAIHHLFSSTKVPPKDVGILVVNCGVLNTTPSLAAMVINRFKLRTNVQSFNLGGMGCSGGVTAVEVAKDLLRAYTRVTYALVVTTEAVSFTWYKGDDRDKLLPNCFLRMGAAALLLSSARRNAKYQLHSLHRTTPSTAASVRVAEDAKGVRGISITAELVNTLVSCLSPRILQPGFDHACVAAMGKKVLNQIQAKLGLSDQQMEASTKTLERFGYTCSSSVWYELAYLESSAKIKSGDQVLQISFGSGLDCNTLRWTALTNNKPTTHSPWEGLIETANEMQ